MCGVFGIIRTDFMTQMDKEAFTKMSYLSSTRGIDSTGYLALRKEKGNFHSQILKAALDPIAFSRTIEAHSFMNRFGFNALLGHTRYKTKGDVNSANAHPFRSKCGNYVLFHNGTLTNLHNDYDTDSEWLCNRIAAEGGNLGEALCGVHGAYTLIMYEEKERKISIVRNRERPLWYAQQKDGLVYASEPWMINAVGIHTGVKELATKYDEHERINVQFNEKGEGVVSFDNVHIRRFSAYGYYGHNSNAYGKYSWEDGAWEKAWGASTETPPKDVSATKSEKADILPFTREETKQGSGTSGGQESKQVSKEKAGKNNVKVDPKYMRSVLDSSGEYWSYQDFAEIGYQKDDIIVLMSMLEDFESRIDRDGVERIWVKTSDDFIPYVAYRNALSSGCSYCGSSGPMSLCKEKKLWFSRYEFLCESCDNKTSMN